MVLTLTFRYGLLLTCSSGSLVSLYQCARYIFTSESRPRKLTTSSLVVQAFCVLAIISTLSVAIGLVDTWLHAVTSAVLYSQVVWATSDALSSPAIAYGTQFNASACNELSGAFCGQEDEALWTADPAILLKGFAAAGNISTVHLITTLNDEGWMAIVTRPGVLENVTYTASSIGLTASCVAFTSECLVGPPSPVEVTVNCSNIGLPGVPVGQNTIFLEKSGFQVPEGVPLQPQEANSNIFDAQIELYYPSPNINGPAPSPNSAIISGVSPKQPSNGTGATPGYLLLANCTFAAYDIVIEVTPGAGTALVRKSNASDETTGRLWPGLLYRTILNGLIGNTLGIAMTSDSKEQVLANLSQEIARLTVATVAGILAPTVPDAAGIVSSRLVSAYPIAPLALFLVLLFAYSIVVIILFVWSASASSPAIEIRKAGKKSRTVSLMQLVQMRLTNPLSFVASVFNQPSSPTLHFQQNDTDPADLLLSLETDVQKLFAESANTDPLVAAFSAEDNHLPMFEIKRRSIRDGFISESLH